MKVNLSSMLGYFSLPPTPPCCGAREFKENIDVQQQINYKLKTGHFKIKKAVRLSNMHGPIVCWLTAGRNKTQKKISTAHTNF